MRKGTLVPYYEEHKITKKGESKKKCSKAAVEVTLDINRLLSQYGEEVERRTIAEMQLHSIQMCEAVDVLDIPFEEVNE